MSERTPAADPPGPVIPGNSGTPEKPTDAPAPSGRGRIIWDSVREGNSFTVTALAIFTALVVGGLLNAFTNKNVLNAWGNLLSAPGQALAQAWATAVGAYVEMFEGSIFNPQVVAALCQQASISTAIHAGYLSAVFNPLSETCVQATPLILAGLAVALPYQAGMFNIGGQSQFIGGALLATYLGYGVSMPFGVHVIACVVGGFVGGAGHGSGGRECQGRAAAHPGGSTPAPHNSHQNTAGSLSPYHHPHH